CVPIPPRERPGMATPTDAECPGNAFGKVPRLNDDGSAPADNPFVGRAGSKPELFVRGIRNAMAFAAHPETCALGAAENAPQGGRPVRRDPMLTELKQRIREVRQGPDGLLYLLADEAAGALLRIEPATEGE